MAWMMVDMMEMEERQGIRKGWLAWAGMMDRTNGHLN